MTRCLKRTIAGNLMDRSLSQFLDTVIAGDQVGSLQTHPRVAEPSCIGCFDNGDPVYV